MSKKDWNRLAKIEQAISKRYGDDAIQNPKANWTDDKEKEYLAELKSNYRHDKSESERVEVDGVLIST